MTANLSTQPRVAIACGGTGGHLFPGLAVAERLVQRGCAVTLLVSNKEVDRQGVEQAAGMEIVTLPAVGLTRGRVLAFARGFWSAYSLASKTFQAQTPAAALAMGGFTSAPPLLAAKRLGARTFLHESNTIPGRANRWLSRVVDRAFIGFPSAANRLHLANISLTGTPVRPQFQARAARPCREALGLEPERPTVLIVGGSQGASGLNDLVLRALPGLAKVVPAWQWIHLTGPADTDRVRKAYDALRLKAVVQSFCSGMELALGAATVAVSRAGASSLAELAAMRVPPVLVPYPAATDDHQFHNARAFEQTGAARLLPQGQTKPEQLGDVLLNLMRDPAGREQMQAALEQWHHPRAAADIAEAILSAVAFSNPSAASFQGKTQVGTKPASHNDSAERKDKTASPGHSATRSKRGPVPCLEARP